MPYRGFLAFNVPAVAVWAVTFGLFGYLVGRNVEVLDEWLRAFGWLALILLGPAAVAACVVWSRQRGEEA